MSWERTGGATRLVLVRHGEIEESARGRFVGWTDVPLSERGAVQARRCAEWLAPAGISVLYSSPSARAAGTARPVADVCGVELGLLDDLREIHFGALEGLTLDEAAALHPEVHSAWARDPAVARFPGGEDLGRLQARALRAFTLILARHPGATIGVVSHGGPIRALLVHALGADPRRMFRLDVALGSVSVVDWFGDEPLVRLVNHVP